MEIQEVIRRWQAGNSQRQIAAGTGLSRDTVRKYLAAAQSEGIARAGPGGTEEQLSQAGWRRLVRWGRGRWRHPARTCFCRGRTRSTSGLPMTGCR